MKSSPGVVQNQDSHSSAAGHRCRSCPSRSHAAAGAGGGQEKAQRINCVNNLKQSGLAFRIGRATITTNCRWTFRRPKAAPRNRHRRGHFHHFQVMSNELSTPKILICPADNRTVATSFARLKNQNVSYFAGLDANDVSRPQSFSTGDRNITMARPRTIPC